MGRVNVGRALTVSVAIACSGLFVGFSSIEGSADSTVASESQPTGAPEASESVPSVVTAALTTEPADDTTPSPAATTATTDATTTANDDTVGPEGEGSTDLTGTWLVVREVETDIFGSDQAADARDWNLSCLDADCSEVEVDSAPLGLESEFAPVVATFDGTSFRFTTDELLLCFDPTTGDYTGPEVTRVMQTIELEVTARNGDGDVVSLAGTEMSSESTPESAAAECETGEIGETSDQVMFRPDLTVGADPPVGVVRGAQSLTNVEGEDLGPNARQPDPQGTFENRILLCEDDTCDFIVRQRMSTGELFDVPVSGDAEGGYEGSAQRVADCVSDTTGEMLIEDAYTTTASVTLRAYAVEGGEVVGLTLVDDARPTAEAFTADPDNCYPNVYTSEFLGRVVDDPVDEH